MEDKIICPYCTVEIDDELWEYFDSDGEQIKCDECGEIYNLEVCHSVHFSTTKKDCKEKGEEHILGKTEKYVRDLKTCERYNAEAFIGKTDWEPCIIWKRHCVACDEFEYKETGLGESDPWRNQ